MLMVSFFQVVSQFGDTYYLQWPSNAESAFTVCVHVPSVCCLTALITHVAAVACVVVCLLVTQHMQVGSVFNFDLASTMRLSCFGGLQMGYFTKFLVYLATPVVVWVFVQLVHLSKLRKLRKEYELLDLHECVWDAVKRGDSVDALAASAHRMSRLGAKSMGGKFAAAVSRTLINPLRGGVTAVARRLGRRSQRDTASSVELTPPANANRNALWEMYAGKKTALKRGKRADAQGSTDDGDAAASTSTALVANAARMTRLRELASKATKRVGAVTAMGRKRHVTQPLDVWVEWHRVNAREAAMLPSGVSMCACIDPFPGWDYNPSKLCARGMAQWRMFEARNRATFTVCALFMFMYLPVTTHILSFFLCEEVADTHYLVVDRSTQCFTREWWEFFPMAVAGVVTFVLGVPVGSLYILHKNRTAVVDHYISLVRQPYNPGLTLGVGNPRLKCCRRPILTLPRWCNWGRLRKLRRLRMQQWQWVRACAQVGVDAGSVGPGHPAYDDVQVRWLDVWSVRVVGWCTH